MSLGAVNKNKETAHPLVSVFATCWPAQPLAAGEASLTDRENVTKKFT